MRVLIGKIVKQVDGGHSLDSVFDQLRNEVNHKAMQLADAQVIDTSDVDAFGPVQRIWKRHGDEFFLKQARGLLSGPTFRVWDTKWTCPQE